jgi:CBS domain-containing protein
MKTHGVRRLPVVGFGDTVLGIVSLNDLVLAGGPNAPVRCEDVVDTLQTICAHNLPASQAVAVGSRHQGGVM